MSDFQAKVNDSYLPVATWLHLWRPGRAAEAGKSELSEAHRAARLALDLAGTAGARLARYYRISAEEVTRALRPAADDRTAVIGALRDYIGLAALSCAKAIGDVWSRHTGETEMPLESSWAVRVEALGFFIHLLSRFAHASDPAARDVLLDAIVPDACRDLVQHSWQPPGSRAGVDVEGIKAKMIADVVKWVGDAEEDYSACPGVIAEQWGSTNEEGVVGRLTRRLGLHVGHERHFELRLFIGTAAAYSIPPELADMVEKTCRAVASGER